MALPSCADFSEVVRMGQFYGYVEVRLQVAIVAAVPFARVVLEKAVTAELQRGAGFHWKIIHFSKPEYDITKEVTNRLNQRYKRG